MTDEEAIALAKSRTAALFGEENIQDLRLEEIERKHEGGWFITVSFVRKDRVRSVGNKLSLITPVEWDREEKIVEIAGGGDVVAIRHG